METMRRSDRKITVEEAKAILDRAEYGVLSTVGNDGQPYGIPLSYVFKNNSIYFHCALSGHKLDAIEVNPKVSFCVVGHTKVLPSQFATEYESVVAFGVASEVKEPERYDALLWLLGKYSPHFIEEGRRYIEQYDRMTKIIKIDLSHISGKARK